MKIQEGEKLKKYYFVVSEYYKFGFSGGPGAEIFYYFTNSEFLKFMVSCTLIITQK
jgi:hypothetical protein